MSDEREKLMCYISDARGAVAEELELIAKLQPGSSQKHDAMARLALLRATVAQAERVLLAITSDDTP